MEMTSKGSTCPLQLSSFFQYWPLRRTYQSSAWRGSREVTFSIYFQLWATMHTWSLPWRNEPEGTLLSQPLPNSAGARSSNYSHLSTFIQSHALRRGRKLQATGDQIRKTLWMNEWIPTDNYWYRVIDTLYQVLLRLTVPALGFCWSSLDKVVTVAAEEGILSKSAYIKRSPLSQESMKSTALEKGIFKRKQEGLVAYAPFSGKFHRRHQSLLWPRGLNVSPA